MNKVVLMLKPELLDRVVEARYSFLFESGMHCRLLQRRRRAYFRDIGCAPPSQIERTNRSDSALLLFRF